MSATSVRVQPAQPESACQAWTLPKKTVQRESAGRTESEDCEGEPIALGASLHPIAVSETAAALSIRVPLNGIDARHVYVLASEHAITIEIRDKHTIPHSDILYQECQHECVTRELQFHSAIKEGSTNVRMGVDRLEITCRKEPATTERSWSEFIQFNTRGSLGSI